jgi:protoporphyrinogen/coproporphyrinogen III oxidase
MESVQRHRGRRRLSFLSVLATAVVALSALFILSHGTVNAFSPVAFTLETHRQPGTTTSASLKLTTTTTTRTMTSFLRSKSDENNEKEDDQEKNKKSKKASNDATSPSKVVECLVIGGGISGSTLAHNLNRRGVDVLLAEARDYLGGNVKSHRNDEGFLWEEGPNSFATQPSIVRIACELGISDQLVFADESLPPWVNHNGKLHPLPKGQGGKGPAGQIELVLGPNGVLKFALLGELLSWPGKIRAGIGAFIGHAPAPEGKEETIREWVTRILGEEVFLRCIDPFVSGVYAGNPETLSMKAALPKISRIEDISYSIDWNKFGAIFYGGLKRQIELTKERKADPPEPEWPEFEYGNPGSFREGLATLPNAIKAELGDDRINLQWKVTKIERLSNGDYKTTFETPKGNKTVQSKTVVSTAPAHALADVLQPVMPESKSIFNRIRKEIDRIGVYYPPVAAVTVAYPKSSFKDVELPNGFGNLQDLPGFGSLNPRTEGVRTLGTLWSSSLFPGRAPKDYNLLLNYIGGSRDTGIADLSDEEIIQQVDEGCRKVLLKEDAPEPKVIGMKVWPTAIPQYELGHLPLMKELEDAESKLPGLWVCGNYRTGVAFPDCVTFGYEHAKVVKDFLEMTKVNGIAESNTSEKVLVSN